MNTSNSRQGSQLPSSECSSYQTQLTSTRNNNDTTHNLQCFLVISYHDLKLGIAFYRPEFEQGFELLHEVYEYYDFNFVKTILEQVQPTDVITSSKVDIQLVNYLKVFSLIINESEDADSDVDILPNKPANVSIESDEYAYAAYSHDQNTRLSARFKLHILSNRFFNYETCKNRILSMNLSNMANMIDRNERFIYLTANMNFAETNTVKSLGVLLYFLEKNCSFNTCSSLSSISYFNLLYVTMDQSTFNSLEIFQQEWHPSTLKKGIYKKEGLSVFGIFNSCASKLGSIHLRKIFQQPITDFENLTTRQNVIEFFTHPSSQNIKELLFQRLKHIKDVSPILTRFKASTFKFCDFQVLLGVISNMIFIRNIIANANCKNLALFTQIAHSITDELEEICHCLQTTIDYDNSIDENIEINTKIDTKLDKWKMLFNKLPQVLNRVMVNESEQDNSVLALKFCNLTNLYVPQIGFLLAIPLAEAQKVADLEELCGLEAIFCANDRAFCKNKKMKEFDTYYGDIVFNIAEQSRKVLIGCRNFIMERKKTIKTSISLCSQLDAMIAMAATASKYKYTRPVLNVCGTTKIEDGRHPLYELLDQSFVPNPFDDEGKICVVFGPNNCGKSVYLKQVSLIIYLAHIGSFVPAKFAKIRIVDQIFTRIQTPESISSQLSAFKHDLDQIIMATKYATKHSLVVIDFFGKGTLSIDGYSLLSALIRHWAEDYNRPHVIISSQFNINSQLSHLTDLVFFTFETINNLHSYSLICCENEDGFNILNSQDTMQPRITEMLIDNDNLDQDLQSAFPKLSQKYNSFVDLGNFIISQDSLSEQVVDKINQLVNLLSQKLF